MVTTFADHAGDRQWIHVDPERRRGGFGCECVWLTELSMVAGSTVDDVA